jgi:surface antigen
MSRNSGLGGSMSRYFPWSLYNGTATTRLWQRTLSSLSLAAPLLLAIGCGGCSLSYQLDSLVGQSDKTDTTGSINSPSAAKTAAATATAATEMPPEHDLAFTRAAVTEVLSRDSKDVSLPWENPESGARGMVTPIATAYSQDGTLCRDFLASYVFGRAESWLRGEACRQPKGKWEVLSIKPWARS